MRSFSCLTFLSFRCAVAVTFMRALAAWYAARRCCLPSFAASTHALIEMPLEPLEAAGTDDRRAVFTRADEALLAAVQVVADPAMTPGPGDLDFSDLRSSLSMAGRCRFGRALADAEDGPLAAERALLHTAARPQPIAWTASEAA